MLVGIALRPSAPLGRYCSCLNAICNSLISVVREDAGWALYKRRDSAVTRLQAWRPRSSGSIPGKAKRCCCYRNVQTVSCVCPASISVRIVGCVFRRGWGWGGRLMRETDHFSPSTAEIKNGWSYASTLSWLHGLQRQLYHCQNDVNRFRLR
jgi:hypothetical protein